MALVGLKQDRGRGYGNRALFFSTREGGSSSVALLFEFGRSGFLRWLHWFFFFLRKSPSS